MSQQTNWIVFTGAPCSGKTEVIDALARDGYQVCDEIVRRHFEEQLAAGVDMVQLRQDIPGFQRLMFDKRRQREDDLAVDEPVILDRAIPDSIAYYHLREYDAAELIEVGQARRYRSVFLFERLPMVNDDVRNEDEERAGLIEQLIIRAYTDLGYELTRVPVMSIAERCEFVRAQLDALTTAAH